MVSQIMLRMEHVEKCRPCVCVPAQFAQKMRQLLESKGAWDERFRLIKLPDGKNEIAIPILNGMHEAVLRDIRQTGMYCNMSCRLTKTVLPPSKKMTITTPLATLTKSVKELVEGTGETWTSELASDIPKQWEKHGDLILLPEASFKSTIWENLESSGLWEVVARSLGGTRVARKGVIQNNDFRSPRVDMLLGEDGWVEHVDNGIRYTYDIRHCMFSSGNITEKLRVGAFNCEGETVVDLYAGIGYFTLPYLVHAKASMVHACEWNPHAVRALDQNLRLNNVMDRCFIHAGDNTKICPKGIADRVNLGLIPSSETGWPVACAALKPLTGGMLHVHGNVTTTLHRTMEDSMDTCDGGTGMPTISDNSEHEIDDFSNLQVLNSCTNVPGAEGNLQVCRSSRPEGVLVQEVKGQTNNSNKQLKSCNCSPSRTCKEEAQNDVPVRNHNASGGVNARRHWNSWAKSVAERIKGILEEMHGGKEWKVNAIHVEHVKSYAPHVDHVVADLECRPKL